jgi:hypothetical protein
MQLVAPVAFQAAPYFSTKARSMTKSPGRVVLPSFKVAVPAGS